MEGYVNPQGRVTKQRDYCIDRLNAMPGISVVKPKAAFYCFPKIDIEKYHIKDDMQFAYDLLKQEHVLIVQGTGFNWPENDHFRIVYLPELTTLAEALDKLEHFLDGYTQGG